MSEIDNWDEQFRDQLADQEFPFDEANWEKARDLIDKSRAKKRRRALLLWWPTMIGLAVATGALGYRMLHAPSQERAQSMPPAGDDVWTQVELTSTEQHLYPVQNSGSEELQRRRNEYAQQSKRLPANATWQQYVSFNSNPVSMAPAAGNYVTVQGTTHQPGYTAVAPGYAANTSANSPQSAAPANNASVQNTETTYTGEQGFAWMQPVAVGLNVSAAERELISKPLAVIKSQPGPSKVPVPSAPRSVLWVEAGSDYSLGWKNNGVREGNGFNPIAGIGYSYRIWRGLGASVGVQYNSISRLGTSTYSATTLTEYDFGRSQQITNINTTRLHYLVVPVKVNYAFNNNIIGLGCNVAYLMQANNTVESYRETRRQQTDYQKIRSTGYRDGFNNLDLQVSLSYKRYLFKGLSASAEMFYGLSPVKKDQWLRQQGASNHSGFKVLLSYDLFRN